MTEKIKQIIIVIIVIIVAFIGFKMFFPNETGDQALVADSATGADFAEGQVILSLLNQLEKVTLDTSVFSGKAFSTLINFEKPIPDQATGRPNPFSRIGIDGSSLFIATTSTTTLPKR